MQRKKFFEFRWGFIALITVLTACGGGGGASDATDSNRQVFAVPDLKYNVQTAVLNADVNQVDSGLSGPDINGIFIAADISTYQTGQVFVFNKKAFKIKGINPLQGGTTGQLLTRPALLAETYSDLKFNYTMHPVMYDANGKVQSVEQVGVLSALRNSFQVGVAQTTAQNPSCLVPKKEISASEDEFGIEYEVDCTIAQLLSVVDSESADWLHIKGKVGFTGKTKVFKDIVENTEYVDTTNSGTLDLTAGLQTARIPFVDIKSKLDTLCSKFRASNPELRCEIEEKHGELKASFAIGLITIHGATPTPVPIPVYLSGGILLEIGFKISGEVTIGGTISKTARMGHIQGIKVQEQSTPVSSRSESTGAKANGELDLFVGIYGAAGIGADGNFSGVEARLDLGIYATGTVIFPPPCLKLEVGVRTQLNVTALHVGAYEGFTLVDQKFKQPFSDWSTSIPQDCDGQPGKISLKYTLNGKNYYSFDSVNSTPTVDSYLATHALVEPRNGLSNGQVVIDLTDTRPISGRALSFEVSVLDAGRSAYLMAAASTLAAPSAQGVYRAVIDVGNTSYGDSIKLRILAFVPGDRANTQVTRDISIIVETQLAATPIFYNEIDTFGEETYEMQLNFGSAAVASRVKSGYILLSDGSQRLLELDGTNWKTTYSRWLSCSVCTRIKPTKLVLFTDLIKTGMGQSFEFTEDTIPRVATVEISPASIKVGDVVTAKITGRLIPPNVQMNVPNCANLIEVRTFQNNSVDNWASNYRVFTCNADIPGNDLIAKTIGIDGGIAVYSILSSAATVPTPTSLNLLLGATVTDSCMFCSNYSVYGDPNYLTDGNITSGRNLGTYSGSFNIFPLSTISIDRLVVYPIMTPNGVVTYEVQTSASPVGAVGTFTSHGIRSSAWASGVPFDILLNVNTTGVRVVKLIIHSSPSWVSFSEIQGFLGNTLATFNDTFGTASLDTNLWASASGYGLGTVAGGLLDLAPGAGVSTLGKRLFSGSKIDISTLIKVAGGSAYDTYLNLYDAATNEAINVGEHPGSIGTTGPLGLYAYGSGGYAFTGTNRTPASVSGVSYEYSGVTTTQFKVLNIQIDGNILTVQRGDQSAGGAITYSESFTRNLGRSIVGRQFYLLIANHASGSQNAKVDWIKVATQ